MQHRFKDVALCLILAGCATIATTLNPPWSLGQQADDDARRADEERQRKIVERFQSVLEKNPRRGTALDRLYGFHVEWGTLDQLVAQYNERIAKDAADGAAWMVLGLIESQRGKDAAAMAAFREAETHLPASSIASYYLGQSLVLVGQPEQAAEALERAIVRKPPQADLLEIFQALGRVHQRAQRSEQALEVWNRLEKLFPDDTRVQEQIASTLVEENQPQQALPRYEALAGRSKDPYKQSLYRMEAAELKVRLGQSPQALTDFEALLGLLNPDNWLYREVRRRIDEVFLRSDDQAGLAKYYETWIDKHPDDVEAMARLARILAGQARVPEAQSWLEKALKRAPSRKDLRLAFIEQLVLDRRFADAVAQYEALDKFEPNHPDHLREWGKLILRDTARPEAARRTAAAAVWQRLTAARPKDPLTATQVADLCRHAELSDEALAYYRKAVELAPESSQYREYLGEYYHSLKRSEEALATWREIAAGANKNAKNLARLAEVMSGFGYQAEALPAMAEACMLEPDDFTLHLKYVELLDNGQRHDDALARLGDAEKLVTNAEEAEAVLALRIKLFQATDKLTAQIETLDGELKAGQDATAKRWFLLARYCEAARQLPDATAAIDASLKIDGQSIPALAAAARIHESGGNVLAAAETNRKLAAIDRRYRTEYLTNVARLEARLGRREPALAAGRDLLVAAPGNPEHYDFYAQLCFQLGEVEEGLNALRRSVRLNPTEPKVLLTLAAALAEQFRTDEAIELYWQAFDKAADLDGKLGIVPKLSEMYLQSNHFDRLTERLERQRREAPEQRELSICLAQAYQSAGDYGTARQELEKLLTLESRDTQLLQQLATLAEGEGDLAAAVKFQRQLLKVSPAKEQETRLAQLLLKSGEADEASAIWVRQALDEHDPERMLKTVDSLLTGNRQETALAITERVLRDQPRNWEMLYREGVALALPKPEDAARRFQALLDLKLSEDDPSLAAKARKKQAAARAASVASRTTAMRVNNPVTLRTQAAYQVRRAAGFETYYSSQPQAFWAPDDYGQARIAALGWLLSLAQKQGRLDPFLQARRAAMEAPGQDTRAVWDWYYLQSVRQDQAEIAETGKRLAKTADPVGQWLYLATLGNRQNTSTRSTAASGDTDLVAPLADDELDHVLACYDSVKKSRPELLQDYYGGLALNNILTELKRAKRVEQESQLYRQMIDTVDDAYGMYMAMQPAAKRGDLPALYTLLDRAAALPSGRAGAGAATYAGTYAQAFGQAMSTRADAKSHADIPQLLDRYLAFSRAIKQQASPRSRAASSQSSSSSSRSYFQIYLGKSNRSVQIDWPAANEHFDQPNLQLLRNAFELYKRDDLLSDLFAHWRGKLDDSKPAENIQPGLALAYLHWWNDEKDEATAELGKVCDALPGDISLRLEAAGLRERNGEFDEALALAESITPLDHPTMQRRETLALRLSVRTGDIDRARQAAERLFGLRLDTNTQIQLAAQMRQLNMHDLAEAVLARAGRQAGSGANALVSLMGQYQSQNKTEIAVQIAHQILRRSPVQQRSFGTPYTTAEDSARQQAVAVLARSGKLKELIERVESQIKNSPKSLQLHQTLAEYHKAAGDRDKAKLAYLKLAEIQPHDGRIRYQVAQQVQQLGDVKAALEHYAVAIKQDPRVLGQQYYNVQNAFQQANKLDDLIKVLNEIDLRSLGQSYYVTNLISNMMRDSRTRGQIMPLFRKAWDSFPEQRVELLGNMHDATLWRAPEMYEFIRQSVIPQEGVRMADPWSSLSRINSYGGDGKATGVLTRVLEVATQQNKLVELSAEVEQALVKRPEWDAGKALLALLQIRRGQIDEGQKTLAAMLDDKQRRIPSAGRWLIAQELEGHDETRELATRLYESTVGDDDSNADYSYSPLRRLVHLYDQAGRKPDARELVLKLSRPQNDEQYGYDPEYAAYRRVERLSTIGDQLLQLGYPVDAVRIFGDLLSDDATLRTAQRFGGNGYRQRAEQGLAKALKDQKPEMLAETLKALLKIKAEVKPGEPALDLMVLVAPPELRKATVTSMIGPILQSAAAQAELQAQIDVSLAELLAGHSQDLSVRVAAALAAAATGKADRLAAAVQELEKLLDASPLEPLPAGTRPNARQRAAAAQQLGLWLVARECFKENALRPAGEKLAAQALEAARRQAKPEFTLAMLREWGQVDLDRGDRRQAEARWTEMLELALADPLTAKRAAKPSGAAAPVAVPASCDESDCGAEQAAGSGQQTASGGQRAAGSKPASVPVVTLEQYARAIDIARLAAENGMHALSLRAVRMGTVGGPPIQATRADTGVFGSPSSSGNVIRVMSSSGMPVDSAEQRQSIQQVFITLTELTLLWKKHGMPDDKVYETLVAAVLPDARPNEVFPYPRTLSSANVNKMDQTQSLSRLLAERAVQVGKVDDLRRRLTARQEQPLGALPARVVLAQLALAASDEPRSTESLSWLLERVRKEPLQNTAELACHAALPAMNEAELAPLAASVVEQAVKSYAAQPNVDAAGSLLLLHLARHRFKQQETDAGRQHLQEYLQLGEKNALRYRGDSVITQRRTLLQKVATEYARAGLTKDGMDILGQHADIELPANRMREVRAGNYFNRLATQLAALPAAERYDLLKVWSLPTEGRKSVRLVAMFSEQEDEGAATEPDADPVISSAGLLIEAARQHERLDELAAALEPLAAQSVENARSLFWLCQIARGQASSLESDIAAWVTEYAKQIPKAGDRTRPVLWADYLVARGCLAAPPLAQVGERLARELLTHAQRLQETTFMSYLRADLALATASRAAGRPATPPYEPGLALWHSLSGSQARPATHRATHYWTESNGVVSHLTGTLADYVYFDYPLSGEFEFSVDSFDGYQAEGHLAYGGLGFEPQAGGAGRVFAVTSHDAVSRACNFLQRENFNRHTLRVSPAKLQLLVNGHLFYEEDKPSPTSPWLALLVSGPRETAYRKFSLSGRPQIPRQVELVVEDRLEGWVASFFGESQPLRRASATTASYYDPDQGYIEYANAQAAKPTEYDWRAKDGEIHGRQIDGAAGRDRTPSRLYYHRPLRSGETLSYEFFYEPDKSLVYPALDRLAFLVGPAGVRVHWMNSPLTTVADGTPPEREADEPANRRGPETLPLKPGEWNQVALALQGDVARLTLNGELVYQRPLEAANDRRFGFFRWKNLTAARLRNVVLRGDWPQELSPTQLANLAAPAASQPGAEHERIRAALLPERFQVLGAGDLVRQTRKLPPAERYEQLARWVLPGEGHAALRLYAELGGEQPLTPALELIAAARECGQLDDLAERIRKAPVESEYHRRCRMALLVPVSLAQNRDDQALAALKLLSELTAKVAEASWATEGWPELLAARSALDRPALRPAAAALIDKAYQSVKRKASKLPLDEQICHLHGRARLLSAAAGKEIAWGEAPRLAWWSPVTRGTAATQGAGKPRPHWSIAGTEVRHYPGHAEDCLYLAAPLAGNFEVQCEVTVVGYRDLQVVYNGLHILLNQYDRKKFEAVQFGRPLRQGVIEPPLPPMQEWSPLKLVVEQGTYTAYLDGRKLYEERLPAAADPWLFVRQKDWRMGGVRGLRIIGQPTVPEKLELSASTDLGGWLADYYAEPTGAPAMPTGFVGGPAWTKKGGEIYGRSLVARQATSAQYEDESAVGPPGLFIAGSKQESLLRYHRPLLEDGEIEYEFFHEPGKTMVHPALDRLAFLLESDGVKVHRLTAAQFDRTGLPPDNATVEAEHRRGPDKLPLRSGQWNQMKLSLRGDRATLALNGETIYERPLEPENQRFFGLFHYADETEVRVRHVVYRGAWPRQLPPEDELWSPAKYPAVSRAK